jgi:hypothetical protein
VTEGIPGENAEEKGLPSTVHVHESASIVTGIPEAPGA